MTMDPRRFPNLQRKVIELQLAQSDWAPAEASIEEYLKDEKLADGERSWALQQKAHILMNRGSFADARSLLTEALRLSNDTVVQGEVNYHVGYCVWKMGDVAEAERILRIARISSPRLNRSTPTRLTCLENFARIRTIRRRPSRFIRLF